ncbi:hypothetical protein BX616_004649, partial [Lobosporangium transversale]
MSAEAPQQFALSEATKTGAVQVQQVRPLQSLGQQPHVWTPSQELAAKLVFGGLGCMIAVVFTHPVDVIKTRLQLQGEAGAGSVVPSMHISNAHTSSALPAHRLQGITSVVCTSTTATAASSSNSTSLQSVSGSGLLSSNSSTHLAYSPMTTPVTNVIHHRDAALLAHETMVKPGGVTGAIETTGGLNITATGASPTVKSQAVPRTLRLIPLLREIMREEGPRVLMAGLAPAVLRESIYSTIRFGSYDLFKGIYSGIGFNGLGNGEQTTVLVKLLSGLTSGMIGSVIANPTDLIK